jgi:hypothetical protein
MADTTPNVKSILTEGGKTTVEDKMDQFYQTSPLGQISSAVGDNFFGLNHRQQPGALSINKDYFGLTFFTRPRMNLTTENLRSQRQMTPLLTTAENSVPRIIRCLLDHELVKKGIKTQFVDEQNVFIPLLTNNLLSISGWPDLALQTTSTPEGVYKEVHSMVDSVAQNYSTYDITANFRNLPGDPITSLFMYWGWYSSLVYQGLLVPYPDMIIQHEIDTNTRIYRLVLDSTKTRVQKIGACGVAIPVNAPIGAAFNYEADRPINASNDQVSIRFQAMGFMYQDDILIDEFNRATQMFNGTLQDGLRESSYKKVPMDALGIFNNRGYPRINPDTYELEWWVSNDVYNQRLPSYKRSRENDPFAEARPAI